MPDMISVWFDGVELSCVVDTGSQVTVVRESAAARLGTLGPPLFTQQVRAGNGAVIEAAARRLPNVGTADLGWPHVTLLVVPDQSLTDPCILGTDLLAQQSIVVDWRAQTVRRSDHT